MYKVKLFDEEHELDLEDEVNMFLDSFDGEIIDIKYQVALCHHDDETEYCFSCLIIYKDNE